MVLFVIFIAIFYAVYLPVSQSEWYKSYLAVLSWTTSAVLTALGQDASVASVKVSSPLFAMTIVPGCDGMEAFALFVGAILSSPVSLRLRLLFLVPGLMGLWMVNLVRLVSIFFIGAYYPNAFEFMHRDIWPGFLIVIVLVSWLIWARWAWRQQGQGTHVQN